MMLADDPRSFMTGKALCILKGEFTRRDLGEVPRPGIPPEGIREKAGGALALGGIRFRGDGPPGHGPRFQMDGHRREHPLPLPGDRSTQPAGGT